MAVVWEQRRESVKFMHVFPLLQEEYFRLSLLLPCFVEG